MQPEYLFPIIFREFYYHSWLLSWVVQGRMGFGKGWKPLPVQELSFLNFRPYLV